MEEWSVQRKLGPMLMVHMVFRKSQRSILYLETCLQVNLDAEFRCRKYREKYSLHSRTTSKKIDFQPSTAKLDNGGHPTMKPSKFGWFLRRGSRCSGKGHWSGCSCPGFKPYVPHLIKL